MSTTPEAEPKHYWASGMHPEVAQKYLADLCGSESQNYTEFPEEVTCERCLAALRTGRGAPGTRPEGEAASPDAQAAVCVPRPSAPVDIASTLALLKKRKEFETELAKLINRLSLESTFGNVPDYELARQGWEFFVNGAAGRVK